MLTQNPNNDLEAIQGDPISITETSGRDRKTI